MALSFGFGDEPEDLAVSEAPEKEGGESGSEASDDMPDIPDTHCPACEQEFGTQDLESRLSE